MALPPNTPSAELESYRQQVEDLVDHGLANAVAEPDDLMLIATFVRAFTFLELNLHRAIRLFRRAGALTPKECTRPAASDLPKLVLKGSTCLTLATAEAQELKSMLTEIEARQPFRNLLAHWALARLPGTDVLVFVTMDERDAKQVDGGTLKYNHLFYGMAFGADLRGLSLHMTSCSDWVASQVAQWQAHLFPDDDPSVGP